MSNKKITLVEWFQIASNVLIALSSKLDDDGSISMSEGLSLINGLISDILSAYIND